MPRQKEHDTPAARAAAYRERKKERDRLAALGLDEHQVEAALIAGDLSPGGVPDAVTRMVASSEGQWQTRAAAVAEGKLVGELEARSRRLEGDDFDQWVRRAMHHHAWLFDGKPEGQSPAYYAEFGIHAPTHQIIGSLDRPARPQVEK